MYAVRITLNRFLQLKIELRYHVHVAGHVTDSETLTDQVSINIL